MNQLATLTMEDGQTTEHTEPGATTKYTKELTGTTNGGQTTEHTEMLAPLADTRPPTLNTPAQQSPNSQNPKEDRRR